MQSILADQRPRKEMASVLKIGDAKDGWGLAFWFAGLYSFLDDARPPDALATDPERVIVAAQLRTKWPSWNPDNEAFSELPRVPEFFGTIFLTES